MTETSNNAPYRILHVTDDFSTANTGVTSTVRQIAGWQAAHCDWVGVYTAGKVDASPPEGVHMIQADVNPLTPWWRYPAEGSKGLAERIRTKQITHLHIHEFWRGGYVCGMLAAHETQVPILLSAHGSTSPWALYGQSLLKNARKWVYWNAFARFYLRRNVHLHAITPLEARNMHTFFGFEAVGIVPNAIRVDQMGLGSESSSDPVKRIGFLGRLHPVKGIDLLIEAFGKADLDDEWELVIAGPEEIPAYAETLKAFAAKSPRHERIHFLGPIFGDTKEKFLQASWVLAAPSRTEVIGMVNLEAAGWATPTITSRHTGLEEWADIGGILVDDNVEDLRKALNDVTAWPLDERLERGKKIRKHVLEHYSFETVGKVWLSLLGRIDGAQI